MYAAFTLLRVLLGHEGAVIPATRSSIRLGIRVTVYGANRKDIVEFEMYATFSTKGKKFSCIVISNTSRNAITSTARLHVDVVITMQSLKCKARLLSHGSRVVEDRQPDHTHDGNM